MESAWILVVFAGWMIGLFLVLVLMQVAGEEDDAASNSERRMNPRPKTLDAEPGSQTETGDRQ